MQHQDKRFLSICIEYSIQNKITVYNEKVSNLRENNYTIRQVINLTGVSEFVLRAWENRYDALKPKRTKTGRRLYSKEDVLKARLLFELTERDHKIGSIAQLTLAHLQKIAGQETTSIKKIEPAATPHTLVTKLLNLAHQQQWDDVQSLLRKKRKASKAIPFIHQTILPLIREVSLQVEEQRLSIAQEHMFSSLIKENLYLLKAETQCTQNKIKLVIAGPEGDFHEIGLLISLVIASHAGIKILYLGANLPKRELCEASIHFKATHIVLSSTISKKEGAKEDLFQLVHFLDTHLPSKISLWIGGRNTQGFSLGLNRDCKLIESFEALQSLCMKMSNVLNNPQN